MRFPPLARITCLVVGLAPSVALAQPPASASDAQQVAQTPAPPDPDPQQPAPAPAPAAPVAMPAPHAIDPVKARYNVQVMEAVLERSVRYAASQMNRRLQAVSPDLLQLSGAARARGFRLPGYGVFFDVDVPAALRHTMGWTLRLMQQNDQNVQRALTELKQALPSMDPKQRAQSEMALKILETRFEPPPRPRQLGPQQDQQTAPAVAEGASATETVTASSAAPVGPGPLAGGAGNATAINTTTALPPEFVPAPTAVPAPSPQETPEPAATLSADELAFVQNPDLAYEMEVRDALASAMLEYGGTLSLGADEYLTIAARDSENVVMPGDLSETVTVLLRIKGSDLYEYKSGRLTEADARHRIEVREF